MGMIADELDIKLVATQALLSARLPLMVNGAGLMSATGGPVLGVATVIPEPIYMQMTEISKAFHQMTITIRKLEDKIKKLEDARVATPGIPQGFRRP